jgi:hypothetical protein
MTHLYGPMLAWALLRPRSAHGLRLGQYSSFPKDMMALIFPKLIGFQKVSKMINMKKGISYF